MNEERNVVYAIGAGMGTKGLLTREAQECIEACDILMGSRRMTEAFQNLGKPCFCEYRPQKILEYLTVHPQYRKCAVLFSGDIGFYSGAKKLSQVLEDAGIEVRFLPGISSVVYLASRLNVSWEDAKLTSLHGREEALIDAVARYEKTFCLLGGDQGREFCQKIKKYDFPDVRLFIGRRLSYADEEILERSAGEAEPRELEGLVTVLIENPRWEGRIRRRPKDEEFIRGNIPMTKAEVRAVSLAKLGLAEGAVFYDIGAGTGSISVEAALSAERIRVYAIEKNPEGIRLIEENHIQFKTEQIEIIEGEAPEVLEGLEAPTHVLIGGSSGKLKEILRLVREKNPYVLIVIHAVSLETLQEVTQAAQEGLLYDPEVVQIQVAKARKLGEHHLMMGQNPVYLISDGGSK
ncbi:MAG: precorrin-6Y C5,15-methyltransferase (decarboxylating) subunit CbiT [Coprococcus sp.]|nr:precorrin-6Y C5,15-methyltransferase (decarboxylating) subunit CbiT [Coprococcus sp.]